MDAAQQAMVIAHQQEASVVTRYLVTRVKNAVLASATLPFLVRLKVLSVVVTATATPTLLAARDNAIFENMCKGIKSSSRPSAHIYSLPSLQENTSNIKTFTIDDEGAGNIWLLGWTRSENPKLNLSVQAPPAPATTSFASAASSSTGTGSGSGTIAAPTTAGAVSGARSVVIGGVLGVGMVLVSVCALVVL
ncbi:MAG: hypothetical protein L6R37_006953 [Teloschistes peruensis]|nr:MAG: hypothetical protein L6R37_006953 [Teloschistes peruensis]